MTRTNISQQVFGTWSHGGQCPSSHGPDTGPHGIPRSKANIFWQTRPSSQSSLIRLFKIRPTSTSSRAHSHQPASPHLRPPTSIRPSIGPRHCRHVDIRFLLPTPPWRVRRYIQPRILTLSPPGHPPHGWLSLNLPSMLPAARAVCRDLRLPRVYVIEKWLPRRADRTRKVGQRRLLPSHRLNQ